MTQEDAKREIVSLYKREYLPKIADEGFLSNPMAPVKFYAWLQKHHPNLLDFEYSGDNYQIVKIWVGLS